MNCSETESPAADRELSGVQYAQVGSLVLLGLCSLTTNTFLAVRLGLPKRRKTSFARLLRAQSVLAVVFLLSAVPIHLVAIIGGDVLLGELLCGGFGVLFQILLGLWTSFQALVLFERYTKIMKPCEHLALFSKVNIKLMMWGMALMHGMMSLGPLYGWGQYTHANERFRFWLTPSPAVNSSFIFPQHLGFINSTEIGDEVDVNNFRDIFPDKSVISIEFFSFPSAMYIDVTGGSGLADSCINEQYSQGVLGDRIYDFLLENSVTFRRQFEDNTTLLNIQIDETFQEDLTGKDRDYYDSTICEMNYQAQSGDDSFYVMIMLAFQLMAPLLFMVIFIARIVYTVWIRSPSNTSQVLSNMDYVNTLDNLIGTICTMCISVPYFACNIAVRNGHSLSPSVHFVVRILLYSSTLISVVVHSLVHRSDISDTLRDCLDSPCRGVSVKPRRSNGVLFDELDNRSSVDNTTASVILTDCSSSQI